MDKYWLGKDSTTRFTKIPKNPNTAPTFKACEGGPANFTLLGDATRPCVLPSFLATLKKAEGVYFDGDTCRTIPKGNIATVQGMCLRRNDKAGLFKSNFVAIPGRAALSTGSIYTAATVTNCDRTEFESSLGPGWGYYYDVRAKTCQKIHPEDVPYVRSVAPKFPPDPAPHSKEDEADQKSNPDKDKEEAAPKTWMEANSAFHITYIPKSTIIDGQSYQSIPGLPVNADTLLRAPATVNCTIKEFMQKNVFSGMGWHYDATTKECRAITKTNVPVVRSCATGSNPVDIRLRCPQQPGGPPTTAPTGGAEGTPGPVSPPCDARRPGWKLLRPLCLQNPPSPNFMFVHK